LLALFGFLLKFLSNNPVCEEA